MSHFLSQMKRDECDPHKVIPVSFNSYSILKNHYNTFSNLPLENYHARSRSKANAEGIQLPK